MTFKDLQKVIESNHNPIIIAIAHNNQNHYKSLEVEHSGIGILVNTMRQIKRAGVTAALITL